MKWRLWSKLSGRGGAPAAWFCGQGALFGEEPHYGRERTKFSTVQALQTDSGRNRTHFAHGTNAFQLFRKFEKGKPRNRTRTPFQISLVLIFILAVIIYRTLVSIPLFQNETLRPMAQVIASMSGAMVNLILIMSLGRVYEKLALRLTTWGELRNEFGNRAVFAIW